MTVSEGGNEPFRKFSGVRQIFHTLRSRNYRLFFIGSGISLIGTWMQQVAMGWLVYRLSNSPLLLGIIAFSSLFPGVAVTPLAGVLSDRWSRHRMLLGSQFVAMCQAGILAALTLSGLVSIWHIVLLSVVLGLVSAFEIPARQSLIVELIDRREYLGSAIALNSALFNAARLLGPSLAGMVVAVAGEGVCFLLNGLSYLALIVTLLMMQIDPAPVREGNARMMAVFKAGISYAVGFLPVRYLLLLLSLSSFMGMPYTVLMPVFAKDIFEGGPQTLGFLMAAAGGGAQTAALYIASLRTVWGMGRLVPLSAGLFGLFLVLFSLSRVLWVSLLLLFFIGAAMMFQLAVSNTMLQTMVDDDMRGRAMSFFALTFIGVAPIGGLLSGAVADVLGAPMTLLLGGLFCIAGSLVYAKKLPVLRDMVRAIYIQKGVITDR